MATKVFCNICEKFIQDVTINEAYNLSGNEVCVTCKAKVTNLLKDFTGISEEAKAKADKIYIQVEAELAKIEKVHAKIQKRLTDLFIATRLDLEELTKRVLEGKEKPKSEVRKNDP